MLKAIPIETTLETKYAEFQRELEMLINRLGLEVGSNTPDFILAEYLTEQLRYFDFTAMKREAWEAGE